MFTLEIDDLFNGLIGVYAGYFIDDLLWVGHFVVTEHVHVDVGELFLLLVEDALLVSGFREIYLKVLILADVETLSCLVDEEDQSCFLIHYDHTFLQIMKQFFVAITQYGGLDVKHANVVDDSMHDRHVKQLPDETKDALYDNVVREVFAINESLWGRLKYLSSEHKNGTRPKTEVQKAEVHYIICHQ